ncbi:Vegetative incompatibility protein HET-E-1 [Grifola frondosa]|uniref:Vegetative incompatibility protein HET-E-1 n=1 Tax=Grifola frondosa TaxID=5627 RepID=A0A1C7MDP3_GRIFR|nr:Vegetative incompatibility protein HET-E-1 [Grifola frondosa]
MKKYSPGRVLSESRNEAREVENRSRFMKSIWSDQNAKILEDLKEQVNNACRTLGQNARGITMDRLVDKIATEVSHITQACSKLYDEWHQQYVEQALKDLPHADASYKAFVHSSKAGFLAGTRTELLEELEDWAHGRREDLADKPVYILSGAAGTGKSTIAYEIARRLDRDQILGASFFFLRGAGDLSSTRLFFSTIAYQLALFKDLFCDQISAAAKSHVMNGTQQMGFVVDELIQEPLKKVPDPQNIPPTVVVIDAVDECTDEAQERVPHMLHLLLRCVLALKVPLRILITTRPELHIEDALQSAEFKDITKPFNLHNMRPQIIDKDIELYIEKRLGQHEWTKVLLEQHTDVALQLAKQADGLFIYAKVVVDFLVHKRQLAREYLNALIAKFSDSNIHRDAALARLDMLYTAVLESAFPDIRTDRSLQVQVQDVLGCIAILQDHVSPRVLCSLVRIKVVEVEFVIDHLRAIIIFDKTSDAKIHPLHASFPQFLLDENRCTNEMFWVDSCARNSRWAAACLSTLNDSGLLRRNVCDLPDPLLHKDEVSNLSTHVNTHLPVHTGIQYACLHWATHLRGSGSQDVVVLVQYLETFCRERLLFWIEALSMMGRLDVAVTALINARDWYAVRDYTSDAATFI